jgi:glycosyltransferase involved in cell wall biosynthesis
MPTETQPKSVPGTRSRHILHVIATLDPKAGGPSEFIHALFRFAPEGYTGEIVTLDDPASQFLADLPFPVHALGPIGSVYGYHRNLLPWLRANRERFDGVILNGLWVYCGLAVWRAFRGRKPYVVFAHGMLDPYFKRAFPRKHLKKWAYWLVAEYWILRGAWKVLFTTREEAQLATESFSIHRWNECVVPIGAQRPPRPGDELREAFYQHLPEIRGRRLMLFLGRIHRKKGCDMLIEAFIRNAPLDPGLHLVMAGPDQQGWSDGLKAMVEAAGLTGRVHWPGMLQGNVKWGAFFASEIFILPSHQENFGIAVAEALACSVPVLLADKVNIAREIAKDGAGLIEPDTQPGTDSLVRSWMSMQPSERAGMSRQALATFNKRYDMSRNAATILQLFNAIPAANREAPALFEVG